MASDSETSIARAIDRFIEDLISKPSDRSLDHVLEAALLAEHELRVWFVAGRQPNDPFIGLINIFTVHPAARRTRRRYTRQGTPEFNAHYILPLDSRARRLDLTPSTVYNIDEFRDNWGLFSQGVLSGMRKSDWENVIVAGGSVLACLMAPQYNIRSQRRMNEYFQSRTYASSNIDLFIWGLSSEQAEVKMEAIYKAVRRSAPWPVICVRKAKTVSIHTIYPFRPVQIILRLYQSPAEILTGLDVDASCCAYDGNSVWVNPRAMAALVRQANTVDLSRRLPSYEFRLAKYAQRGFEVYIPSLQREKVKPSLYKQNRTTFPTGLARLLVLEAALTMPHLYLYLQYPEAAPSIFSTDNYDEEQAQWAQIPYGPSWDPATIKERIIELVRRQRTSERVLLIMPVVSSLFSEGSYFHRHVFIAGTMQECLEPLCRECDLQDDNERSETVTGSDIFIRGRIRFMTKDPSNQLLAGSFRPSEFGDWSNEAYTIQEATGAANIRVIDVDVSDTEESGSMYMGTARDDVHEAEVNSRGGSGGESLSVYADFALVGPPKGGPKYLKASQ